MEEKLKEGLRKGLWIRCGLLSLSQESALETPFPALLPSEGLPPCSFTPQHLPRCLNRLPPDLLLCFARSGGLDWGPASRPSRAVGAGE